MTNVHFLITQNLIKCHEWQGWLNQHIQYHSVQYLLWIFLIVTLGYISECSKVEIKSILCVLKQKQFLKYFSLGFHCSKLCLLMFMFVFIFNTTIWKTKKGSLQGDKQYADCMLYSLKKWHILEITILDFSSLIVNYLMQLIICIISFNSYFYFLLYTL